MNLFIDISYFIGRKRAFSCNRRMPIPKPKDFNGFDLISNNPQIKNLEKSNEDLVNSMYNLEVELSKLNQYGRRENIEIANIPESIPQRNLESHVIEMLGSMGVEVESYDIAAIHRLGKQRRNMNRNVIVRFINRKHSIGALNNKKKLLDIPRFKKYMIFVIE